MTRISYGLYIVSSVNGEKNNGQIANTVFQVTAEPAQIAVCLNKKNLTHEYVAGSGKFAVSVLSKDAPLKFIGDFGFRSGRDTDKFNLHQFKKGANGCPISLEYGIASIEAEVVSQCDAGSHTIFVGRVTEAEIFSDGEPMTYEYYHNVVKGKAPKAAPTFKAYE